MSLASSSRTATQRLSELTEAIRGLGVAASTARPAAPKDAALADAVRRGQTPELIDALRKALGV